MRERKFKIIDFRLHSLCLLLFFGFFMLNFEFVVDVHRSLFSLSETNLSVTPLAPIPPPAVSTLNNHKSGALV